MNCIEINNDVTKLTLVIAFFDNEICNFHINTSGKKGVMIKSQQKEKKLY